MISAHNFRRKKKIQKPSKNAITNAIVYSLLIMKQEKLYKYLITCYENVGG